MKKLISLILISIVVLTLVGSIYYNYKINLKSEDKLNNDDTKLNFPEEDLQSCKKQKAILLYSLRELNESQW